MNTEESLVPKITGIINITLVSFIAVFNCVVLIFSEEIAKHSEQILMVLYNFIFYSIIFLSFLMILSIMMIKKYRESNCRILNLISFFITFLCWFLSIVFLAPRF